MKKIALMTLGLVLVAGIVSAETTLSAGIGFARNTAKVEGYKLGDSDNMIIDETLKSSALAINLDAKTSIMKTAFSAFGGLQIALPSSLDYTLDYTADSGNGSDDEKYNLNSGYNITGTLGAGYNFFKNSPIQVFAGAGLALNTLNYTYDSSSIEYVYTTFGVVGTVQANYFFTSHLGALVGLDYGYYFAAIKAEVKDTDAGVERNFDFKDSFKSVSNYNIRAGVSYRF